MVLGYFVAPFTGAWIETCFQLVQRAHVMSHPSRVRGLKPMVIEKKKLLV